MATKLKPKPRLGRRMVTLRMRADDWMLLRETLDLDSVSPAFSPELRSAIATALSRIKENAK